ncbi:MAG: DUF4340 domain-containing protein [Rickettsiales bacterium]|nr:DUF4340 domain-containing protein [Pseudomonadota bacterium]MDA0966256.1 DUF4340 domain-containing protein [Pseudomonadota bacterium]MDG4543079.1 DUF4340 domain-containing protein [Rickettsiales bacterium]MDG4545277.1 DUF4340 domain-containing protein [Rickettsiales bacterium]MDG4547726.1 DUF4340 domain-containing protein [Rickettsiales bacterium]
MAKKAVKKKNDKKLLILASLTLTVLAYMFYIVSDKSVDEYEKPRLFFIEELQGKADDVATIVIYNKDNRITIRKRGGKWVIEKMYDYVVDEAIINKLIVNVQELKVVEKKTDNPKRFEDLGVLEEIKEDYMVRVVMSDATEDIVYADFIRGKQRAFGKLNNENAIYVRKTDENQVWLVKGDLDYDIGINTFLNRPEYDIAKERVMKVTYTPQHGEEYEITRMMPTVDFDITGPSGKEPESKNQLNKMGEVLDEGLTLTAIRPDSSVIYNENFIQEVSYRTYDGIDVILTVVENSGEGVWAKISARAYKNTAEGEAKRINDAAKGWVYKLSDTTSDFILKKLSDIEMKPKEKKK